MSAASMRLVTLLLGIFCGWSLLALLVVEAGLGARYSLHPEDQEKIIVPPSLRLNQAQSALGSLGDYAMIGERPLFNADRRPLPPPEAAAAAPAPAVAAAPLDVLLTSVVLRGDTQVAQFTDRTSGVSQTLRVGQSLAGEQSAWKLVELAPRAAVFEGPSGRVNAELRVFDGQGGEAPTAPPEPQAASSAAAQPQAGDAQGEAAAADGADAQSPESRAEMIRRRIEERRRQMREEAARAAENRKE
jgi:general secretion pathway protein N